MRLQEEIIYAVDINHRKDHHLDGTDLLKFSKPSVLILDSQRARSPKPDRNTHKHVLNSVVGTLRAGGGGNVLLPVDTAGRCLDLLLLLEQHWIANKCVVHAIVSRQTHHLMVWCWLLCVAHQVLVPVSVAQQQQLVHCGFRGASDQVDERVHHKAVRHQPPQPVRVEVCASLPNARGCRETPRA